MGKPWIPCNWIQRTNLVYRLSARSGGGTFKDRLDRSGLNVQIAFSRVVDGDTITSQRRRAWGLFIRIYAKKPTAEIWEFLEKFSRDNRLLGKVYSRRRFSDLPRIKYCASRTCSCGTTWRFCDMHISSFLFLVFCICLASSTSAMTASKRRTCYLFNRFLLHHCITSMSTHLGWTEKVNASRNVCRNVFRSRVPELSFHGVLRYSKYAKILRGRSEGN